MKKTIAVLIAGAAIGFSAARLSAQALTRRVLLSDARECSAAKVAGELSCTPGARVMLTLNADGTVTWSDWK
jgi:hypothetical protein